MFQAKAVSVAEQCRVIGEMSGVPYMVENPVSVLSRVFGKPSHTFDPCDYTAYEPLDNYTKKNTKPNRRRQPMSDYKQRMIREHRELQERISKLAHMLEGYAEGTLDFTPACSFQLLESQLYAMGTYANILQERARIEQVDLNAPLEGGESGEVSQD